MSAPLSHRAAITTFAGLAVVVVIVVSAFVWPGFLNPPQCAVGGGTGTAFQGREYCTETTGTIAGGYTDTSFRGYDFHLVLQVTPGGPSVQVRVTEPNGTNYTGSMYCGVVCSPETPLDLWFTPDEQAGVQENWTSFATLLFVAA